MANCVDRISCYKYSTEVYYFGGTRGLGCVEDGLPGRWTGCCSGLSRCIVASSGHFAASLLLGSVLVTFVIHKHSQHAQVIACFQRTGHDEGHPEDTLTGKDTGDERACALAERLDHVNEAHRGGAFAGLEDGGKEGGTRSDVHGLGAGAENKEEHGEGERGWDWDECQGNGGREMSEDHCLDETDAFGDRGCDDGGSGGNKRGGEKEGAETAFEEMELAIEEICHPGSTVVG